MRRSKGRRSGVKRCSTVRLTVLEGVNYLDEKKKRRCKVPNATINTACRNTYT